jgi:putative toxin-antitoxin system antitoxin component (TIGR02293 family)
MAEAALRETLAILGLKKPVRSSLDLMPVIRKGLPAASLEAVSRRMDQSAIATIESLGLAKRTIARRLHDRETLTSEESERVVRLARVLAEATKVLGSVVKARSWLRRPNRALGGESPVHMLDTDIGTNAVLEELGRIEHGVFA